MKRLNLCVITLFTFLAVTLPIVGQDITKGSSVFTGPDLSGFPVRHVLILPCEYNLGKAPEEIMQWITTETTNIFKYPYYDSYKGYERISPTLENMVALSEKYNADIVIVPVLEGYYYRQFTPLWIWGSGEQYIDAYMEVSLFSYNKKTGILDRQTSSYRRAGDSLDVPAPLSIARLVMDSLFKKFPYKRIPTDMPIH